MLNKVLTEIQDTIGGVSEARVSGQLVILKGSSDPPKISQYAEEKAL